MYFLLGVVLTVFFGVGIWKGQSTKLKNKMRYEQWQEDTKWSKQMKSCPPPPPNVYVLKGF